MGITKTDGFTDRQLNTAEIFKALGHPARMAIVEFLINSPACICGDIVSELPLAQSTISRHLKELKQAGIIQGNISGNNICYCINEDTWLKINALFKEYSVILQSKPSC